MVHLLYERGGRLADRIQTGSGPRPERAGSPGAYGQVVSSNAGGSPGSYRVLIARTLSTKALPKIPGRQWQTDRFASGRDALSVFARDIAEAELIVGLCKQYQRSAWIYGRAHRNSRFELERFLKRRASKLGS